MVEAFGGAGWGATPEDLERYLLWLGRHGLTDFVLHLSQYQLSSAAIRDWPPSQPLHLNWAAAYPEVLRRVRAELKRNPTPPADTLVVAPYRGIMAAYEPWELRQTNIHNAATFPDTLTGKMNQHFLQQVQQLYDAGMNYHIADERTLEAHGVHDAQGLRLGKCVYQKIVVADGAQLNGKGRHLLERVQAVGGVQKHPSPVRINVDLKPIAAALESIAVKWSLLPGWFNAVLLEPVAERSGWFSCDFVCEAESLRRQPMGIIFADAIAELTFNGSPVHLQKSEDGMIGRLPQLQITPVTFSPDLPDGTRRAMNVWMPGASDRTVFTLAPWSRSGCLLWCLALWSSSGLYSTG